jgi:hypothetical protein
LGATELHAAFREESRASFLSTSAALQEIQGATDLFVAFLQEKPHPRSLPDHSNCETALAGQSPVQK